MNIKRQDATRRRESRDRFGGETRVLLFLGIAFLFKEHTASFASASRHAR